MKMIICRSALLLFLSTIMFIPSAHSYTIKSLEFLEQPRTTDGEIDLPTQLQHLDHIYIHHFKANPQEGSTCGNHAVFNALAIQKIIEENEVLSAESVQHKAQQFFPHMREKNYKLTFADICKLAQSLQLKNTHIVAYNRGKNQYYSGAALNANHEFNAFIDEIRSSRAPLAQFILNYSDHWVTVSVMKHQNNFHIIYHNSRNTKLIEGSDPFCFLEELCARLM